jgi:hypothetical protein
MNQHKSDQLELSPSSEEFNIVDGGTFFGVFDESHIENKSNNQSNTTQKKLSPRIMVATRPDGIEEQTTIIERANGTPYTFKFFGIDEEGIPMIWLV